VDTRLGRSWTALIVPSGRDYDVDSYLCSFEFLRRLVYIRPEDPGLILQLSEPPREIVTLTDVFPAFRAALADSVNWPGVLLWTRTGDSVFLPFHSQSIREIEARAHWIFSHLATAIGVDLELLRDQYRTEFSQRRSKRSTLHVIHISDVHIGSREANLRLDRVQQLILNLVRELDDGSRIVPIVSGDLMDSPDEANLGGVKAFLRFVSTLGTEEPITLLGNHDVRQDGYLGDNFKIVMGLSNSTCRVAWYEEPRVAIACFNSVMAGKLARGYIGEGQFGYIGGEIDSRRDWQDYILLSTLHHHPIPVELPDWYARPFYERILGRWYENSDSLEDADQFLRFSAKRGVTAILHGHKHIPRLDRCPGSNIPVVGCGSTVGKISTEDRTTYMSINVLTIDTSTQQMSARLLAERIQGEGLSEERRHESVLLTQTRR